MSNIVLNETFKKLWDKDANAEKSSQKTRGALLTYCMNANIDFTKETLSPEQLKEIKGLIPMRFPPEAQKLLKMGAQKAEDKVAAGWDGTSYNTQGRAKNWRFWNNEIGNVMRQLAKGVERRKQRDANVSTTGNTTRSLMTRLDEEQNKLYNALFSSDVDKLPGNVDLEMALDGFQMIAKALKFNLVKKD